MNNINEINPQHSRKEYIGPSQDNPNETWVAKINKKNPLSPINTFRGV